MFELFPGDDCVSFRMSLQIIRIIFSRIYSEATTLITLKHNPFFIANLLFNFFDTNLLFLSENTWRFVTYLLNVPINDPLETIKSILDRIFVFNA